MFGDNGQAHPLLVVRDLSRDFGGVRAVDRADFAVSEGTITGLIGPNGAGKSTTLSLLAGAIRPSSGTIRFRDRHIQTLPSHRIGRLGVVRTFQISSEFARLSVLENLLVAPLHQRGESLLGALVGKRFWGREEGGHVDRARELLRRFGMERHENEYAANLSGGEKRLLEVMRALMASPQLLLLDEPMAGVTPRMARRLEQHLLELRDEGLSMLMVEHELGTVDRVCHPVIVMAQGRVIAEGAMDELRANREVLNAYLVG